MTPSQSLPIIDVLRGLRNDDRLYKIVSFTGKLDDRIDPKTIFFLSLLMGRKDWVYELHVLRSGFPKYMLSGNFRYWLHREMKLALLHHFKKVFEKISVSTNHNDARKTRSIV